MTIRTLLLLTIVSLHLAFVSPGKKKVITLEMLLDEMVSTEKSACFPDPYYKCLQESSYDRKSVSPGVPGWYANNDGFGIIRTDTMNGRIERVMFDQKGPGVITRIWITTTDKSGIWRFYFDNSAEPGWIIPAYDMMKFGIEELGKGLCIPHTSYVPDGKGGSTFFLPIPYSKSCKITFEEKKGNSPVPRYYQINYRKYGSDTRVETFSKEVVTRASQKIKETNQILLSLEKKPGKSLSTEKTIAPGDTLTIFLPGGENAVNYLSVQLQGFNPSDYARIMREIVLLTYFDGKQTSFVPLSDFSGGGFGAPLVNSWFLTSSGKGTVTSRWLMPYKLQGTIGLLNVSAREVGIKINIGTTKMKWDEHSLYFHASWKQERGLPVYNNYSDDKNCREWNFATLSGKGIYKGDVLTLYNHSPAWYGEGDEKIWVDGDTFPSHFGTGTEDYYNSSWAPVIPFHTPFGGAPRADMESSHGYNTFFRTRNLDGIPFFSSLTFNMELLSWQKGEVDYAATVFWYGDYSAQAVGTSGIMEVTSKLSIDK